MACGEDGLGAAPRWAPGRFSVFDGIFCDIEESAGHDGERERLVVVQEVEERVAGGADAIAAAVRAAVGGAHHVTPHAVVLIRARTIPRTTSGKIQRAACREAYLQEELDVVFEWTARGERADPVRVDPGELADWVEAQVAAALELRPGEVDPDQPLSTYGMESLAIAELLTAIEWQYGVQVGEDEIEDLSISEICERIRAETSTD